MSAFSRLGNLLRRDRLQREIDEELESHLAEAIENGRDPLEARRALGSPLRLREESRDAKLMVWLESAVQDFVFGWRQLRQNKVTSLAALLSLALAIGACGATFRLVDALLLRSLPVDKPAQLFSLNLKSTMPDSAGEWDSFPHPTFVELKATAEDAATLFVASPSRPRDVVFEGAEEGEVANLLYVSGDFFPLLGLDPQQGRLLDTTDNRTPGGHPFAILSNEYWLQRFGGDPGVLGKTFRLGDQSLEVVGVAEREFSGLEPGVPVDLFVPIMMASRVNNPDWSGIRIFGRWKENASQGQLRGQLEQHWRALEDERWTRLNGAPREWLDGYLASTTLSLRPAGQGVSVHQRNYGLALGVLSALADLVLLIAMANVVNLRLGLAVARREEMALRVAIGAGRARLVSLIASESILLGVAATALGIVFSGWAARLVLHLLRHSSQPVQLDLTSDPRVLIFGAALGLLVCVLCGLGPGLLAATTLGTVIRGSRRSVLGGRFGHGLLATQVAFCALVVLMGSLFAVSLVRLGQVPVGFESKGLVNLEFTASPAQPATAWRELVEQLGRLPGVESAALAGWPLLHGSSSNSRIAIAGGPMSDRLAEFYCVSDGWHQTTGVRVLEGTPFRRDARYPQVAMVNAAFTKAFLDGPSAVGQRIERVGEHDVRTELRVVATLADVRLKALKGPVSPTVFIPCDAIQDGQLRSRSWGTVVLRTEREDFAPVVADARGQLAEFGGFRLRDASAQAAFIERQIVREKVLAVLGTFFSVVALLLAGIGLFGVLHYALERRRREIGLRLALGGQAMVVASQVSKSVLWMVLAGTLIGLSTGAVMMRTMQSLMYGIQPGDLSILFLPFAIMVITAVVAAAPAVFHVVTTDPNVVLRAE